MLGHRAACWDKAKPSWGLALLLLLCFTVTSAVQTLSLGAEICSSGAYDSDDGVAPGEEEYMKVALLQTSLTLPTKRSGLPPQAEVVPSGMNKTISAQGAAELMTTGTLSLVEVEMQSEDHWSCGMRDGIEWWGFSSMQQQLGLSMILGRFPPRSIHCHSGKDSAVLLQSLSTTVSGVHQAVDVASIRTREWTVLASYAAFYATSITLIMFFLLYQSGGKMPFASGLQDTQKRIILDDDAEEEEWQRSLLGWLAVSWVNPWVARWGQNLHSALTRIRPNDLPQIGGKELQSRPTADELERLWAEDVATHGLAKANLGRVLVKLWGPRHMSLLLACIILGNVVTQLYVVLLVQHALSFYRELQVWEAEHPDEIRDKSVVILVSIIAFSAVPLTNILFFSIANSLSCRIDQQCGGIMVMLFRKAHRLPAHLLSSTKATSGKNQVDPSAVPTDINAIADLNTLVSYDVQLNLFASLATMCLCISSICAVAALSVLLAVKMGLATLWSLAASSPALLIILIAGGQLGVSVRHVQESLDKRAAALREVLMSIRLVKSYAWEEIAEERVLDARRSEVGALRGYFSSCGFLLGVMRCLPRLLILAGLWGYTSIYGHHDVATIYACLQILANLRNALETLAQTLGRALVILPSIKRIEAFLRLPEAPVLPGHHVPPWAKIWAPSEVKAQASETLYLRGSFSWSPEAEAVLENIDLEIKAGELVAVVGAVGSGKSTLLQTLLGELYPVQDNKGNIDPKTLLSRPSVVAYCSQVPHIAEGTLKQNVVFGQHGDETRYREAVNAACLQSDLKLLPGGDAAPIGARGISLSGGQRSRVSMARAAYHPTATLALFDDPFASLDAPTSAVVLENLLQGPLMQGRTRIVVLQPVAERLKLFDKVVLLGGGKIKVQGTPEEVMEHDEYKLLLRTRLMEEMEEGPDSPLCAMRDSTPGSKPAGRPASKEPQTEQAALKQLREEEQEGRPTWEMVKHYCKIGRWRSGINAPLLFCIQIYCYLLCDVVLAMWTNALAANPETTSGYYVGWYTFWLIVGAIAFVFSWQIGVQFGFRVTESLHNTSLHCLLRAPIDRFFDKQPVGRILNRMTGDLSAIDMMLMMKVNGTVVVIFQNFILLAYVHTVTPFYLCFAALPFYFIAYLCFIRFQNTAVPIRYALRTAMSSQLSLVADAMNNGNVTRAYQQEERLATALSDATDDGIRASLIGDRVLKRWLTNRLTFLWSFYLSTTYVVAILDTSAMGPGTLGLCITGLLILCFSLEPSLDYATGALFELIGLARLHEYATIPQEGERRAPDDNRYQSFSARIQRYQVRQIETKQLSDGGIEVLSGGVPVLRSTADKTALVAVEGRSIADLCRSCVQLSRATGWHRIVSVNDAIRDAAAIASEIKGRPGCERVGEMLIEVQSGWLSDGASIEIESLRAGYADVPQDVLRGITVTIEPRTKVGVVGTTGCGKSTLLLVLLRILEPRSGRVKLNGIDTTTMGLFTLRSAMGLVPQDPVLFSGTLRHNLDPFKNYTDGRLWQALRVTQLAPLVESWPLKLLHQISDEGDNLSFGQRQLLCIARMVLRQPGLLLLDEATSAIDPRTQETVQANVRTAFPRSTIVAVAHRLETILDFDRVVVLNRGVVVEEGPVAEVAQMPGGVLNGMLAEHKW